MALPEREPRWSAPELARFVREQVPGLEARFWKIALAHEEQALLEASLEPGAVEALQTARAVG